MAKFLGIFGSDFPSTAKYEAEQMRLASDYKRFCEYEESIVYKRFSELDTLIHSGDFEKRVQKLKNEKFSDTEAYRHYNSYLALKKSADIKTYLRFVQSGKEAKLESLLESPVYLEFKELEMITHSSAFVAAQKKKDFKNSDEAIQLKRLHDLEKNDDVKFVKHTLMSAEYKSYSTVKNSARLIEFQKLDQYVSSQEFIDFKSFLEDKKRFFKSQEYSLLQEYSEIEKSDDHKWFLQTKKKYPFKDIERLQLSFDDDFDAQKLDASRWITGYYWGKALLNDSYVLAGEKQNFSDKNILSRDSVVSLVTRQEASKGKVWDAERGFRPVDFNYSAAIINTGHSFRQLYGRFEAKVRLKNVPGMYHAFWMLGEKSVPQITVFKTNPKSSKHFDCGSFTDETGKGNVRKTATLVKGAAFDKDYHIFTLDWTPGKLVWKINGEVVNQQTNNVPDQPMYIALSSHVTDDKIGSLPVEMDIDWVRCYSFKK
ncbi:glycosyl hydrolase family 16 [Breznakibacter xylanolyticus]|uniref:Glycosyl hydrolase family 16 n=1 Tax=Breznakibacter xylanolyticus TaxID=990 RepID=A0A2W7MXN8_9BACT|nr:glycoside hydrolase family 16 protein [Breznakibacter xylanolyticus]PZX12758.1 glycosyl hydrolase family 16 [Breznakibacter xylanolyticus]